MKGSREHVEPEQKYQWLFVCAGECIGIEGWSARCRNPSFKRGSAFIVQEPDPDDDEAQRRRIAGTQPGLKGFLARLPALKVGARQGSAASVSCLPLMLRRLLCSELPCAQGSYQRLCRV